jgi:glycerol uptake facilitator protein
MAPLIIGLVVFAIGMSFGANSGYAINPARDLGPRLFAWIQGWGELAVPGDHENVNSYMRVPIVAPLVGGLVGAVVHNLFIHQRATRPRPRGAAPRTRAGGAAGGPGTRAVTRRRPVRAVTEGAR